MALLSRIQNILLRPHATWLEIEQEQTSISQLYTQYFMILALIPAVCHFIGMSIIGFGAYGVTMHVPIMAGILSLILSYILSLVGVYVLALIINFFAPKFGGVANPLNAMKVAVYSMTAAMVGGVFGILPLLGILGLAAGLYSIYLLYSGLPVLMKSNPDKSVAYTAVVFISAIILGILIGFICSLLLPRSPLGLPQEGISVTTSQGAVNINPQDQGQVAITTPNGTVKLDTNALEAASQKMKAAHNPQDAAAAMGAMMGAMNGKDGPVDALPPDTLKSMLPETLANLPRTDVSATKNAAMGMNVSGADARYQTTGQPTSIHVKLQDMGAATGMLQAFAGSVEGSSDSATSSERQWKENDRAMQEKYQKDGSQSEIRAVLKNGLIVEVQGNVPIEQVRSAFGQLNISGLEALQHPKKTS